MNHYPRHIGDYLRDTSHLSLLEHGVYSRLLDLYYLNDGPIPGDIAGLCRKLGARSADEKAALEAVVAEFFGRSETGGLTNKRADAVLLKYRAFGEAQRGRALKRHYKPAVGIPTATDGMPTASKIMPTASESMPTACQPETINQKPETNNHTIPPSPPVGGKGKKRVAAKETWFDALPDELNSDRFKTAWLEWVEYRKAIKKPVNPASAPAFFRKAVEAGLEAAIAGMERSMANGWQGVFHEPKPKQNDHRSEKRSREFAESFEIPDLK